MGALNLPTIASGQLQPYQTSNDADAALESAVADPLTVDLSGGDATLSEADFTRAVFFMATGNAVPRTVNLPDNAHLFVVYNSGSDVLTVASSTITADIAAGDSAVLYTDGTSGGLFVISGSSGASGTAGGDLTGTYPDPTIAANAKAAPRFAVSVSATPGATENNYAPAGWNAAHTTRLLATANAGGTTITGFDATGVTDGAVIYVQNPSSTDSLLIAHADAGSLAANRVNCPGGATAGGYNVLPFAGFILTRVGAVWTIG